jgi:hypothetical protein
VFKKHQRKLKRPYLKRIECVWRCVIPTPRYKKRVRSVKKNLKLFT